MRGKNRKLWLILPLLCCHLRERVSVKILFNKVGDKWSLSLVPSLCHIAKTSHAISYMRLYACTTFFFLICSNFFLLLTTTIRIFPLISHFYFVFLSSNFSTIDQRLSSLISSIGSFITPIITLSSLWSLIIKNLAIDLPRIL